jgi:hypothetical protein
MGINIGYRDMAKKPPPSSSPSEKLSKQNYNYDELKMLNQKVMSL